MEASYLLCRIGEIEGGARLDVVNVPIAVILARHAGLEPGFQVSPEMFDRATQ